jgi:hypothetical protein
MRKTVLVASILTALTASSLAGPPTSAAVVDPAPTDSVVIDILALNGVGCQVGTIMVAASPDNTSFRLSTDRFRAQIGPGVHPVDTRPFCQATLSIHMPAGSAYAIDRVDYGGYASFEPGLVFTQRARHYRTGQTPEPYRIHSWTGPYEDMWETVDTFPDDELFFPPCGTNPDFNAVIHLRLDASESAPATQYNYAALDSIDGPYGALYHLQTRPC